jgi:hypothetical protein
VNSRNPIAAKVPVPTDISGYSNIPVSELAEDSIPPGFEKMAAVLASKEQNAKGM